MLVDEARPPEFSEKSATEDTDDSEEWDEGEEEKYFCSDDAGGGGVLSCADHSAELEVEPREDADSGHMGR